MRGTYAQAKAYCSKDETRKPDGWSVHAGGGGQGERNDLKEICEAIDSGMRNKLDLSRNFGKTYARNMRFVDQYITLRIQELFTYKLPGEPKPWQQELITYVSGEPHPREIKWIWGDKGGEGKSSLAKDLVANHGAFYCAGGKTADILYGYTGQSVVVMDLARDSHEYVNYGALEQLKNGLVYNTKYESGMRMFATPHVLVFSNFEPDRSKISEDRMCMMILT